MNKQELLSHIKLNAEKLDEILTRFDLALDQPDYSPEQVTAIEEVLKLVESKQAKTYKEAVGLYRIPEREQQLKDVALRYCLDVERVPEIVNLLQLKLETLTEAQIEEFRGVCEMIQSGMSVEMAVQSFFNNAKAEAKAKAKGAAKEPSAKSKNGATQAIEANAQVPSEPLELTVSGTAELQLQGEAAANNLSPRVRDVLLRLLDEEAAAFAKSVPGMTADRIAEFRTNLWNQMVLAIDYILDERVAFHMNTPEFAKSMEVEISKARP